MNVFYEFTDIHARQITDPFVDTRLDKSAEIESVLQM